MGCRRVGSGFLRSCREECVSMEVGLFHEEETNDESTAAEDGTPVLMRVSWCDQLVAI